jgi:hypothetical protein
MGSTTHTRSFAHDARAYREPMHNTTVLARRSSPFWRRCSCAAVSSDALLRGRCRRRGPPPDAKSVAAATSASSSAAAADRSFSASSTFVRRPRCGVVCCLCVVVRELCVCVL